MNNTIDKQQQNEIAGIFEKLASEPQSIVRVETGSCSVFLTVSDRRTIAFDLTLLDAESGEVVFEDLFGVHSLRTTPAGHLWLHCADLSGLQPGRYVLDAECREDSIPALKVRSAIEVSDSLWTR